MRTRWPLLVVALVLISSCLKKDEYSDVPIIKYKSVWAVENSLVIQFSFTDGNGDIGLKDDEDFYPYGPCDPFHKNLIIDPYRIVNGEYILAKKVVQSDCAPDTVVVWDTIGLDQRIKYIVREGKDKTLEGDIEVTLNEILDEFPNDSIKFKLTLIDRALNLSNEIETERILTP